jgi:hypothetical protein
MDEKELMAVLWRDIKRSDGFARLNNNQLNDEIARLVWCIDDSEYGEAELLADGEDATAAKVDSWWRVARIRLAEMRDERRRRRELLPPAEQQQGELFEQAALS